MTLCVTGNGDHYSLLRMFSKLFLETSVNKGGADNLRMRSIRIPHTVNYSPKALCFSSEPSIRERNSRNVWKCQ